jgi:hypothetical protein
MVKPGNPLETWTSTETGRPTAPVKVAAEMEASMHKNGCVQLEGVTAPFCFSGESDVAEPRVLRRTSADPIRLAAS